MEEAPLPDGRIKKFARVHRADGVHIIACPTAETVLLLREYRPFYGSYIWSLPGGRVDKESDIEGGAQRELQEETGYRAGHLNHLWTVNISESVGMTNHIFVAHNLANDPLPQDHDELIDVHEYPIDEALTLIESSAKVHLPSAYALQRYLREKF